MQKKQSPNYISILLIVGLMLAACQPLPLASNTTDAYPPPDSAATEAAKPATEISPYPGPIEPTVQPVPTVPPIPKCDFAEGKLPVEPLDATQMTYRFSEPRVVYTSNSGITIAEWLPDNERLLISRSLLGENKQSIEILNVNSGEALPYAVGKEVGPFATSSLPLWLESSNSVAFVDDYGENERQYTLRIVPTTADKEEKAVASLVSSYISRLPMLDEVGYFSKENPNAAQVFSADDGLKPPIDLPLPLPNEKLQNPLDYYSNFQIVFSPDGSKLLQYNNTGAYYVEPSIRSICEISLPIQHWAFQARWSPDGRFVAIQYVFPKQPIFRASSGIVFDTELKKSFLITFEQGFVSDFEWAPSNNGLAVVVINRVGQGEEQIPDKIIFVDLFTNISQIIGEGFSAGYWGVAWSPKGDKFAFLCPSLNAISPVNESGQICIVSVEKMQ